MMELKQEKYKGAIKNIVRFDDKECTGCGACAAVCVKRAIRMTENKEGFLYPSVNAQACIGCGLCARKCAEMKDGVLRYPLSVFAGTGRDKEGVQKSTSGGAFYLLAKNIIEKQGGRVCGAVLDDRLHLQHQMTGELQGIAGMQGSKYIQSRTDACYEEIRTLLRDGVKVLFSGTPCQVAGLKSVVGDGLENLYTIDLVCHGVSSPGIFRSYMKKAYGLSTCSNFTFRQKDKHVKCVYSFEFYEENSKKRRRVYADADPFYTGYLQGLSYRESCYNCKYARAERCGDITLGDCANAAAFPEFADKVLSTIAINTEKGKELWSEVCDQFLFTDADYKTETAKNGQLHQPVVRNGLRDGFYADLDGMSTQAFAGKYCTRRSFKGYIKQFVLRHTTYMFRYRIKKMMQRLK